MHASHTRMGGVLRIIGQLRVKLSRDEIRVPIQTTGAVVLAFGASMFMSANNMTWAVFSALFVVQASVGGTFKSGLRRVAGAGLGAALGVGAVPLPFHGLAGTVLALFLGVGLMSMASAHWPSLAYGLVTVTIITVSPGLDVLEDALVKLGAIGIGCICGMLAAVAVLPVSAQQRTDRHLAEALRACGEVFHGCVQRLIACQEDRSASADARAEHELAQANNMIFQGDTEPASLSRATQRSRQQRHRRLVAEIEHFRRTLTLIERFSARPLPDGSSEGRARLEDLGQVVQARIEGLADAIDARTACDSETDIQPAFDVFCQALERTYGDLDVDQGERERLIALKEALEAVVENVANLCERLSAAPS